MFTAWSRLLVVVGLAAIAWVYVADLNRVPAALGGDEVEFGNHALALARTGHDLNGRAFPLLIQISDPMTPNASSTYWYQPFLFYLIALFLTVLPVAEWSIRLPVALIGLANIALMYAVSRRLFKHRTYALVAAGMLALTPAHVIMSRQALDYLCPLPFVLAWLWCLLKHLDTGRPSTWIVGAALGAGTFSYVAAWALTPMLLAISVAVLLWRRAPSGDVFRLGAGFLAPALLAVPWLMRHPDAVLQTFARYQSGHHGAEWLMRISLYWNFFSPSFLFFAGGTDPTQTTSRAGVFLLTMGVFMVTGLITLMRRPSPAGLILVAGFVLAPLPIVVALPPTPDYSIARALLLLPFGVLIGAHGVRQLLEHRAIVVRSAAVLMMAAMPVQFLGFTRDYFGDYPQRSIDRFDKTDSREFNARLLSLIDSTPTPAIYLDGNTNGRAARWLFFVNASRRPELWQRTRYVETGRLDSVPAGSLMVAERPSGPEVLRRSSDQTWVAP